MPLYHSSKTKLQPYYRKAICDYKEKNPNIKQKDLIKWLKLTYNITVCQKTISNILNEEKQLLNSRLSKPVRSTNLPKYPLVESSLNNYINNNQGRVPITGDILKAKAMSLANFYYPNSNFKSSEGWLSNFKKRHNVSMHIRHGEAYGVDENLISQTLPLIQDIVRNYELCNIFNIDESGLFYKQQVKFKFIYNKIYANLNIL
jgi:hypothetical protein